MASRMQQPAEVNSPDLMRRVRRLEIRAKGLVAAHLVGHYRSVFRGRGLEFSEVRPYQPGDDVRIIDWNVTARTGTPYVKKYVEERELTVLIAVDLSASQEFGSAASTKAEVAAELSALLAFAAVANNDQVGLLTFTEGVETFVPPGKGPRQALRIVRDVLGARPVRSGTNIERAVRYLRRTLHRRSIIFLISDFRDHGFERSLRHAARRHDIIALVLSDPREGELVDAGLIEVQDSETGAKAWLDTGSAAVREQFASQAGDMAEARRTALGWAGVDAVSIDTRGSHFMALAAYLRARAKRR